ncbi:MAG: glutaredoxin family protein [Desulfobacteraceae bacterium]|nr:glutaredoxin family protein [Desulfobacteraceae bacterium]
MKKFSLLFLFVVVLFGENNVSGTEIYQWTDEAGVTHFSDTPPDNIDDSIKITSTTGHDYDPENDKPHANFPDMPAGDGTSAGKKAKPASKATKYPKVELYSTNWCRYCTKARQFFIARNIPFSEFDIEKNRDAARRMKQLTKRNGVPFVIIGDKSIQGFSEARYLAALKGN